MIKKAILTRIVRAALKEDIGKGDVTTRFTVSPDVTEVTFDLKDGERLGPGSTIAEIRGSAHSLLAAERVALNFLQRLSGIATLTAQFVAETAGTKAKVLDTRKTTPNLRMLEKHAVCAGGGGNHRMGLYDQVLIKDNHISLGGGIASVLRNIRDMDSGKLFVEIEVKNLRQLKQALDFEIDRIMLDNMPIDEIRKAVEIVRKRCELEVSGNVSLENVREIAETGVDYISVGSLTHSYRSIDINMKIRKIG
jgi:nicotinate-nucleotide pyrophosphorylase (carboxylating)